MAKKTSNSSEDGNKNEPLSTTCSKEKFLTALEKSLGVIVTACKVCEIGRSTFYTWLKDDPKFKEKVEEISEIAIDVAESNLFRKIREGDTTSIIFYLKTKGKSRGYVEKVQTEHSGHMGLVDLSKLSDKQLDELDRITQQLK